ncbi:MAG: SLBB domain-containing protein [Arcobacteraceae bacterium]|nr:SLBB domain-containing protein [Arcobacteraceae bacterium]
MKKIFTRLAFMIGLFGAYYLFGATTAETTALITQLKNDKSLQDKLKTEMQKTTANSNSKDKTLDKNLNTTKEDMKLTLVNDNNNSKQSDLNATDVNSSKPKFDENGKEIYTLDNYYKNFTPFFYEDQISLVGEIEKRQVSNKENTILERFGAKFFNNTSGDLMTTGVPDDYILSTGDSLKIAVYGLSEYEGELEINKDGKVIIPQVGAITVRGLKYKVARSVIYNKLKATYPNTTINVTIGTTSPFSVSVVGEVKKPGLYTLNALSKVKDALFLANGISDIGTLRNIEIKRNGKVVAVFDLYELLKGGKDNGDVYLYPGDVVFVPAAKKTVYLDGNVKAPAIYELQNNETLKDLMEISGGSNSDSTTTVKIFRSENGVRTLFEAKQNEKIALHDGDKIVVGKISDVTDNQVVLYGNIYKNDSISISKNDTVGSLFKRLISFYGTEKVFMSNTDMNYFVVKRVDKDTLEPKILSGDLLSAINGDKASDVKLQSEDKIFIFNQSMTQDIKYITVNGEVLRGGKFKYFNGMKLIDALMVAGTKKESDLNKIKVMSLKSDHSYDIRYYDFKSANNVELNPYDDINVTNFNNSEAFEQITIKGSVLNEGTYIYSKGLTINDLINLAGGLRQNANREHFELVSYSIENGVRKHNIQIVSFADATKNNLPLKAFDEVMIRQISQWDEAKTITLKGEVAYPGIYTIMPGEKLSSVIKRAGGLTPTAFVQGAVFTRVDIQKLQQDAFKKQLDDLESSMLYLSSQPDEAGKTGGSAEMLQILDSIRKRAAETTMLGRLSIKLSANLDAFEKSEYNVVLKAGDTLVIPEMEQSVAIMGEVMNTTAVTYIENNTLWDYIDQAGGMKESADDEGIFVVRANGESQRIKKRFLLGYSNPEIRTGDTIIVPFKMNRFSGLKFAKDITGIIYQIAVSAAALKTVGAL